MNGIGVAVIAASAVHIIASIGNYLISNDENRNMIVGRLALLHVNGCLLADVHEFVRTDNHGV
jgi:hypothetical protein